MRIVRWLAVIVLVLPAAARADDHRADVNGGLSFGKASKLIGIHVTLAVPIPDNEKWSLLADISNHWDLNDDLDEKRSVYLSGLRYTHPVNQESNHKVFVQGLLGSGHTTLNGSSDADLTLAFGGGWEYILDPARTPAEAKAKGVQYKTYVSGFRAQVDYVIAQGDTKNFPRFTVGYVGRWKKQP
jgi:hypothetical protein